MWCIRSRSVVLNEACGTAVLQALFHSTESKVLEEDGLSEQGTPRTFAGWNNRCLQYGLREPQHAHSYVSLPSIAWLSQSQSLVQISSVFL